MSKAEEKKLNGWFSASTPKLKQLIRQETNPELKNMMETELSARPDKPTELGPISDAIRSFRN